MTTNQPPAVPSNYASLTPAQQDAFWLATFKTYGGVVNAQWVKSNASLKPYEGDTADQMYQALKKNYPNSTPQQRGSTVYQTWLGAGFSQAVGDVIGATGTAVGAAAEGAATGLPSWENAITTFLSNLTSANTWIRAAKVIGGAILVFIGIAHMTGADKAIGGIAGQAVKAAPLL